MDVSLLAQLLRELILDNDRVSLPGMGSFIADIAPAYFSEDGKTIYPPFRRIFFRTTEIWNDELIEKYYAEKLNLDPDSVKVELQEYFEKFRMDLNVKKSIDLPGFGKMRSTKEGNYFFVAEKGLDIYANAFGLEPISLRVLTFDPNSKLNKRNAEAEDDQSAVEMRSDELVSEKDRIMIEAEKAAEEEANESAAVQPEPGSDPIYDLSDELSEPEEENEEVADAENIEISEPELEPEPAPAPQDNGLIDEEEDPVIMKRRKTIIIIQRIVIAILLLVILLLIFKEPISNFMDKQLYSPQDLELIKNAGK